ncbi:MAG: RidA family protein [Syntrophorhabdaceae bacterium]|nr:RidA family protein [Syntrophorhabdaceae bacterium]
MKRVIVSTGDAPKAIGPYSQAVKCNGFLFCSGQIPLDPATGKLVEGGIRKQTERALKNLVAVLEAGGAGLDTVAKTTVYMLDMGEFQEMNEVYSSFFQANQPARATVQVSSLPSGARVEIDAIGIIRITRT